MNKYIKTAGLALGAIVIFACGGGGGGLGSNSTTTRQDTFAVAANESAAKMFGDVGVEVPVNASANGTTLTLSQYQIAPFQVPNRNLLAAQSLQLASSQSLARSVTLTVPDNQQATLVAYDTGERFEPLSHVKVGGRLRFSLPIAGSNYPNNLAVGKVWRVIVGIVKDNLPDTTTGLVHLSGGDDFGVPDTVIYVHGSMDNARSMQSLSNTLSSKLGLTQCYSLAYPYLARTEDVADYLAAKLDSVKSRGKNVTLVGHSRGGIICRYVLERLGRTHAVRRLITLNTPHQGSKAATPANAIQLIKINWLNSQDVGSPLTLTPLLPAVSELMPDSPFLKELNQYHGAQRGDVDYILVGSSNDLVVTERSAQAADHNLYELTSGAIVRDSLAASHSSVKTNSGQINEIAAIVADNGSAGVVWSPSSLTADAVDDGWRYTLTIANQGFRPVVIDDLSFDNYQRSGTWWNVQYFDPNTASGEFFPNFYRYWGRAIAPGGSVELRLHRWPDYERHYIWQAAPENQAATVRLTARGRTDTGLGFNAVTLVRMRYGSIVPDMAKTRRPNQPNSNQVGPMTGRVGE